jgi:hypothetical protein
MTLPLSPKMIAAAYDFLRATPPFVRWKLPHSSKITFRVTRNTDTYGTHETDGREHVISISSKANGFTLTLLQTLAHEMIHLHQTRRGLGKNAHHGAAFQRWARMVCRRHGFDPKQF